MIEFRFENPAKWQTFQRKMDRASRTFLADMNRAVGECVDEAANHLRLGILGQSSMINLRLRAIDPHWVATKVASGWRPETLRRTDQYVNSIGSRHSGRKHALTVPNRRYPGTKITYQQLALYLENGTRTFAPIPHWQPTLKWLKRRVSQRAGKEAKRALRFR